MHRLVTAGAAATGAVVLGVSLAACGGSDPVSAANQKMKREADMYEIHQIERIWHKAISEQNVDLIMTLWAPHATYTIGPGNTLTGKQQIRQFFATQAEPLQPGSHWISETPAYKMRITVNGDAGTLYFECHFVDPKTKKVMGWVSNDEDVQKIGGRWLVTNVVSAVPELKP